MRLGGDNLSRAFVLQSSGGIEGPRNRTIAPARRVEHPLRLPAASERGASADRSSDH